MRAGAVTLTQFISNSERGSMGACGVDLCLYSLCSFIAVDETLADVLLSKDGRLIALRNVATASEGGLASADVVAKLQVLYVPLLEGPVYILRVRDATPLDRETDALHRAVADGEADVESNNLQLMESHVRTGTEASLVPSDPPLQVGLSAAFGEGESALRSHSRSALRHAAEAVPDAIRQCPFAGGDRRGSQTAGGTPADRLSSSRRGHHVAFQVNQAGAPAAECDSTRFTVASGDGSSQRLHVDAKTALGSDSSTVAEGSAVASHVAPTRLQLPTGFGKMASRLNSFAGSRSSGASAGMSAESTGQRLREAITASGRRLEASLVGLQRATMAIFALTGIMK